MSEEFFPKPADYFRHQRREMLEFLPAQARRVLDVGCAAGAFAALLKQRGVSEVWGVEIDPQAAAQARAVVDGLLEKDIAQALTEVPAGYFDCVFMNDVLEHLADPYLVLDSLKAKLVPGQGILICSIPNVRHIEVLKDLVLGGQWRYSGAGVLEYSHLRFFTKKSIREMFDRLGYELLGLRGLGNSRSRTLKVLNALALGSFRDCRHQQFICLARPR